MTDKPTVLFETEGSYPYSGGGVSTWAHILCSELQDKVDFVLYPLTGQPFVESRYRLTNNVKSIVHVPLWGVEEPVEFYDRQTPFSQQVQRKYKTTNEVVEELYFPVFRDFIDRLLDPFQSAHEYGDIIYGFWKYFRYFDYKSTLSNRLLWEEFKKQIEDRYLESEEFVNNKQEPRVFDITFGMRWLYNFMMPLAVPVPDVSVTHATLAGFPAIASIAAQYEYGIPYIVTDHGVFIRERLINISRSDFPFFAKKLLVDLSTFVSRAVYHHADLIAPVTTVNKKWEMRFEAPEGKIDPIYNGVDTDVFKPTPKPSKTADIPTVVAVAHIFPLKDIETMIRSCEVVRREIPDVQYRVYGSLEVDKEYVRQCRKLIDELNLKDNFEFGGFHDTPSMVFNEGDISILSSISEGFPYTVIESMSCARPVVATDVGGIREALEGCGVLCKPRDPQSVGEGVLQLLLDDSLRLEMGRRARERVLLKYTTEKSVDRYYNVYKSFHEAERQPKRYNIQLKSVSNLLDQLNEYR